MISDSVGPDRSISQLSLLTFVGIIYLVIHTNSSKGQSPEITFTCTLNCDNS